MTIHLTMCFPPCLLFKVGEEVPMEPIEISKLVSIMETGCFSEKKLEELKSTRDIFNVLNAAFS